MKYNILCFRYFFSNYILTFELAACYIVPALPILVVYPFLQKYFVTGMALGAVKE